MTHRLASDAAARCCAAAMICLGLLGCHGSSSTSEQQRSLSRPASSQILSTGVAPPGQPSSNQASSTAIASAMLVSPQVLPSDPSDAVFPPRNLRSEERLPFILWLHGLGGSGESFRIGLHVDALANRHRFFYAAPNGTADSKQRRFWNAGPICCDFDGRGVDHVGRLSHILVEAAQKVAVDPSRIFVVGFSNGGFMAHRLACSGAAPLAGIASLAGLGPGSAYPCQPSAAVRVLEVHGDADDIVRVEGGRLFGDLKYPALPSLRSSLEFWLRHHHCSTGDPSSSSVDLLPNLTGAETTQLRFANCRADVELWTIAGGGHMAPHAPGVIDAVLRRLLAR